MSYRLHPTPLTDHEGRRLSPYEIWEGWLGDQTPAEFMRSSRRRARNEILSVPSAVYRYMDERGADPADEAAHLTDDEWGEIANALESVILREGPFQ